MYVRKQVPNLCLNIHCFAFKVWECDSGYHFIHLQAPGDDSHEL